MAAHGRGGLGRWDWTSPMARPSGAFKVTVPVPAGTSPAVYRLRTKVRASTHRSRLSSTFTLPRAIGFR